MMILRNQKWRDEEASQRAEIEKLAEKRHEETLEWQRQVEKNVERRFGQAETSVESRHGRSIGFSFLWVILAAALGGGGFALASGFCTNFSVDHLCPKTLSLAPKVPAKMAF